MGSEKISRLTLNNEERYKIVASNIVSRSDESEDLLFYGHKDRIFSVSTINEYSKIAVDFSDSNIRRLYIPFRSNFVGRGRPKKDSNISKAYLSTSNESPANNKVYLKPLHEQTHENIHKNNDLARLMVKIDKIVFSEIMAEFPEAHISTTIIILSHRLNTTYLIYTVLSKITNKEIVLIRNQNEHEIFLDKIEKKLVDDKEFDNALIGFICRKIDKKSVVLPVKKQYTTGISFQEIEFKFIIKVAIYNIYENYVTFVRSEKNSEFLVLFDLLLPFSPHTKENLEFIQNMKKKSESEKIEKRRDLSGVQDTENSSIEMEDILPSQIYNNYNDCKINAVLEMASTIENRRSEDSRNKVTNYIKNNFDNGIDLVEEEVPSELYSTSISTSCGPLIKSKGINKGKHVVSANCYSVYDEEKERYVNIECKENYLDSIIKTGNVIVTNNNIVTESLNVYHKEITKKRKKDYDALRNKYSSIKNLFKEICFKIGLFNEEYDMLEQGLVKGHTTSLIKFFVKVLGKDNFFVKGKHYYFKKETCTWHYSDKPYYLREEIDSYIRNLMDIALSEYLDKEGERDKDDVKLINEIKVKNTIYDNVMKLAKIVSEEAGREMVENGYELDANSSIMCFSYQCYDVQIKGYRNYIREDYVSITLPYKPIFTHETYKHPLAEEFLESLFETKEILEYVLYVIYNSLFAVRQNNSFYYVIGNAGNGKTAFFNFLKATLAQTVSDVDDKWFQDNSRSSEDPTPVLFNLKNKRIAYCAEPVKGKISSSKIKKMTGTEWFSTRRLHSNTITQFKMKCTFFLVANHMPQFDVIDHAVLRRLKFIEFPYQFVEEPQKKNEKGLIDNLDEILERDENAKKYFIWRILRAGENYEDKNKNIIPVQFTQKFNEFIGECSKFTNFLQENFKYEFGNSVTATEIIEEYCKRCDFPMINRQSKTYRNYFLEIKLFIQKVLNKNKPLESQVYYANVSNNNKQVKKFKNAIILHGETILTTNSLKLREDETDDYLNCDEEYEY